MKLSANSLAQWPARRLDAVLVVFAMLLAAILILREQGRVNDDGVLYLEVARYFARGDWQDGMGIYVWPFYSILIALLSKIGGISLEASANGLSIIFFAITTYALARLIRLANGSNFTVLIGAILLFANPYITGDVMPLIWRDQGFWAFYLTSLGYFIRFYRQGRMSDALLWQVSCVVAALFRTEGLSFLVLIPLVLLLSPGSGLLARCVQLLRAYSLGLAVLLVLVMSLLIGLVDPDNAPKPMQLQIVLAYIQQIYLQISEGLAAKADIFGEQVLGKFLDDYAMHGLVLTLLAIIVGKIANTATLLAFLLAAFHRRVKDLRMSRDVKVILSWVGLVAVINILITLLASFVLAGRYAVPFALLVIVVAAFSLTAICRNSNRALAGSAGPRWLLPLIAFTLCVHVYMIFKPKPEGYTYEKDAVTWALEYAKDGSRIFYDNPRLRYYADLPIGERGYSYRETVDKALEDGSLAQHDFLVMHIERDESVQQWNSIEQLGYRPVRTFTARKKTGIVVFAKEPLAAP